MAAAATLKPGDLALLSRDRDVVIPTGLLVLPEPVVCVNRTGSQSDTLAYGWQFTTQHQMNPTAQYPGVRISTFMDRDGPVQPDDWRAAVAQARATGHPLPRLVPDGTCGMRGDRPGTHPSEPSTELLTEKHKELQAALTQASAWRSEPVAEGRDVPPSAKLWKRPQWRYGSASPGGRFTRTLRVEEQRALTPPTKHEGGGDGSGQVVGRP